MATHDTASHPAHNEPLTIPSDKADRLFGVSAAVTAAGLVLAFVFAIVFGVRRLMLSYLVSYMFVLSIALGALVFVLLQHATKAGWSVNVRRVPELLTRLFPLLAILVIPIIVTFLFPGTEGDRVEGKGPLLYPWAMYQVDHGDDSYAVDEEVEEQAGSVSEDITGDSTIEATMSGIANPAYDPDSAEGHLLTDPRQNLTVERAEHHAYHIDPLTEGKLGWLNRPFFMARIVVYFAAWIAIAGFYYRTSVRQDGDGDPERTNAMTRWSYINLVILGLTLTFASFDLVMSLDPHFFSTIFGGYIFSGGMVGFFAVTILAYQFLRMAGLLKESVTVEHYHDLGKWLFAFTFFWGYIAFSQYMLIWYANIPETTYWFGVRGATTIPANLGFGAWGDDPDAPAQVGWWAVVSMTLLVGHLLIPFAALLSRHVKRNLTLLGFWAGWLLVMHWIDLYWLIMPEMLVGGWQLLPLTEIACAMMVCGASVAWIAREMKIVKLRPAADPRAKESLAFHNI